MHGENRVCAHVFVQDAKEQTSGGMTRAELLITVLDGTVREADVINIPLADGKHMPREVEGFVKTCSSCTFGNEMQEGDRGAVIVPGFEIRDIAIGKMTTVVRESIG